MTSYIFSVPQKQLQLSVEYIQKDMLISRKKPFSIFMKNQFQHTTLVLLILLVPS